MRRRKFYKKNKKTDIFNAAVIYELTVGGCFLLYTLFLLTRGGEE